MLTPADIEAKQFSTTRLKEGYDQSEVDDFFDRVQEDYRFITQQLARLEEENVTLRRINVANHEPVTAVLAARPDPPSIVAEKLIEAAARAADEFEAETAIKADEMIREAGAQGARLVEDATAAAEKIKAEGVAEKYRRNEELDRQHTELDRKVSELKATGEQIRRALTTALTSIEGGL